MNKIEKIIIVFVFGCLVTAISLVGVFSFGDKSLNPVVDDLYAYFIPTKEEVKQVVKKVEEPLDELVEELVIGEERSVLRPLKEARVDLVKNKIEFIEINQPAGKIIYYKDGLEIFNRKILATGDPQGWGGTPAGLYKVLTKNEKAYSRSAEAYMPYAIHFYGKYYVHGEPFYPSGQKILSSVSGGCIRVKDDEVVDVFEKATNGLPVLVVDEEYVNRDYGIFTDEPNNITAKSYAVVDLESGAILAERDADKPRPIASITKLMTAVVVAEHIDLRKGISANQNMLEAYGGTAGLIAGGYYRVVELFYPLLTESSNDSAEVLAGFLGRERTIQLMNEKAGALFMAGTTYADPSGFNEKNISTAKDLTLLARYILNNRRPVLDITNGKKVTSFGSIQFVLSNLKNKNEFAGEVGFLGGKSGYIDVSRYTGVYVFNVKNKAGEEFPIAVSVLGSEKLKQDSEKLIAWAEEQYDLQRVAE